MSSRIVAWAIFIAGLAVLVAFYLSTRNRPAAITDLPAEDCELPAALDAVPVEQTAAGGSPGPWIALCIWGEAKGNVIIDLNEEIAPAHAERIVTLTQQGAYDEIVFHRVIGGFMAQTGDVQFGQFGMDLGRAGSGGSELPDLPAEFSDIAFDRGVVGMARSQAEDSANSQFFIMFDSAPHLNGSYTVVGEVVQGMDVVDAIRRGGRNGAVTESPDLIIEAAARGAPED